MTAPFAHRFTSRLYIQELTRSIRGGNRSVECVLIFLTRRGKQEVADVWGAITEVAAGLLTISADSKYSSTPKAHAIRGSRFCSRVKKIAGGGR